MSALPRRTGAASLAAIAAFTATFILVHSLAPHWARAAGLDFWKIDDAVAELKREDLREREIAATQERLSGQIAAGDSIVSALIEGRMTLAIAVGQIAEINRDRPGFLDVLAYVHPDARTPFERLEEYALAKVKIRLAADPTSLANLIERWELESCRAASPQ